jgi:hypothetical protein
MRTNRAGQSALLLLDAVDILIREDLEYAVIGAFALAVHGTVRASIDADALLYIDFERLKHLEKIFAASNFGTTLRPSDDADPVLGMLILTDAYGNQVDLLGGLKGMDPQVFARALAIPFGGKTLQIVGREDFIAMKCFAGGPQDLIDALSAYQGAQGPVDLDLLRNLVRRFGRDAADRLEQVMNLN